MKSNSLAWKEDPIRKLAGVEAEKMANDSNVKKSVEASLNDISAGLTIPFESAFRSQRPR
jgi:hypothetical protein